MEAGLSRNLSLIQKKTSPFKEMLLANLAGISMIIWIFVMEVRRIVDWRSSFHSISIVSIFPFLILLPAAVVAHRIVPKMGKIFRYTVIAWALGYFYAFFVGCISGNIAAATYSLMQTFCPIGVALYLIWRGESYQKAYDRFLEILFWASVAAAVYGIWQYIRPPAWDVYWLISTKIDSMGKAVPYGLRIFGPLSGTGAMAQLMSFVTVMYLPRISTQHWKHLAGLVLMNLALLFTLSRTCWLQLIAGVAVYAAFTTQRKSFVKVSGVFAALATAAIVYFASQGGDQAKAITNVTNRFTTLNNLQSDISYNQRQDILTNGIHDILDNPYGEGLGTVGTAAKLGANGATKDFDNGYVSRFWELGFMGAPPLYFGILYALVKTLGLNRRKDLSPDLRSRLAVAVAVQVMLLLGESGEDVYYNITGIFFWLEVVSVSLIALEHPVRDMFAAPRRTGRSGQAPAGLELSQEIR